MKDTTKRGLDNSIHSLLQTPEFDRLRTFLLADVSADKPEAEEIIKVICDQVRTHLIAHHKAVSGLRRGL